jgi:predicted DCC family thiol-disulfide oxidoreductase YuxK
MSQNPLILFDGVCNLCTGSVQWIIRRDRRARFRFASLQSEAARRALADAGVTSPLPDSVVLIDHGRVLTRSDAGIGVLRGLGFPWSLGGVAAIVPRGIRDALYAFVAARRYKWFGVRTSCMVPTPTLRARFLDADEAPRSDQGPSPRPPRVPPGDARP